MHQGQRLPRSGLFPSAGVIRRRVGVRPSARTGNHRAATGDVEASIRRRGRTSSTSAAGVACPAFAVDARRALSAGTGSDTVTKRRAVVPVVLPIFSAGDLRGEGGAPGFRAYPPRATGPPQRSDRFWLQPERRIDGGAGVQRPGVAPQSIASRSPARGSSVKASAIRRARMQVPRGWDPEGAGGRRWVGREEETGRGG